MNQTGAKRSKIYFTVKSADKQRILFSASERHGDLQIFPKSPIYHNPSVMLEVQSVPYAGEHFSIHQSPKSPDGNLIKRTARITGADDINVHHFTHAIKRDRLFAHIYTKRAPKLDSEKYAVTKKVEQIISIGEYDSSSFTLYYSLWVGPRDRVFIAPISDEISVTQYSFANFQLAILSSYGCLFSDSTGGVINPLTAPPDKLPSKLLNAFDQTLAGRTEQQCFYEFKVSRDVLHNSYLQIIANKVSQSQFAVFQDVMGRSRLLGFLPTGLRNSAQYKERLQRMHKY